MCNCNQPKTIWVRDWDSTDWYEISYQEYLAAEEAAGVTSAFAETKTNAGFNTR
jgi:hypothetical protein